MFVLDKRKRAENIRVRRSICRSFGSREFRTAFGVGWNLISCFRAGPFTLRLGFGMVAARGGIRFSRLMIDDDA